MSQSDQVKHRFQAVIRQLNKKTWFKKDKWLTSVHILSGEKSPGTVIFQVYKKKWLNEEHHGIRLETFLDLTDKKQKKSSLALQFFNPEKNSTTTYENMSLQRRIIDQIYAAIQFDEGYKLSDNKYSSQPFLKYFAIDDQFEVYLEAEIEKLCQIIGPIVDQEINT